MTDKVASVEKNLLLSSLPEKEKRRLLRCLEAVPLQGTERLYEVGQPIKYVHFPTKGCLISLVKVLDDGKRFDAGPIGYEGMIGVEALLGGAGALFEATVRAQGVASRIRLDALKDEIRRQDSWRNILQRYIQFLLVNVTQVAGCNCFHSLEKHFCAWLLTLQDRIKTDELEITHEVFAKMLGVRRVGITQAARKLQKEGLIRYSWGKLAILDRQRLEAYACVCYEQHTQAYRRLLNPAWPNC